MGDGLAEEHVSRAVALLSGVVEEDLLEPYGVLLRIGRCREEGALQRFGHDVVGTLVDTGMVRREVLSTGVATYLVPQLPETVLRASLSGIMEKVAEGHLRCLAGHSRLARSGGIRGFDGERKAPANRLAHVITDAGEARETTASLAAAVRHEWLCLGARLPQVSAVPDLSRNIVSLSWARSRDATSALEAVAMSGARVRLLSQVRMNMYVADGAAAVVHLAHGKGVLLVRSQAIIGALREYFELLWGRATPVIGQLPDCPLSPVQVSVLRLLVQGLSDDAIGEQLELTTSTVRRHCTAIRDILGAETRFAAGAEAARRGWLD